MDMALYSATPPNSEEGMLDFLLENSLSHQRNSTSLEKLGKPVDFQPIVSMDNVKNWLQVHNQMHQQELYSVGVNQLVYLSDVDFKDPQQWYYWHLYHGMLHMSMNQSLGIQS